MAACELTQDDSILEIGPGDGRMTSILLDTARHVTVVELGGDMVTRLKAKILHPAVDPDGLRKSKLQVIF